MLTIIISGREEDKVVDYTEWLVYKQVEKIDSVDIIRAKSLKEGLEKTKSEYVCYVEPDCLFSPRYFLIGIASFLTNPRFRKLAISGAAVAERYWDKKVYGYVKHENEVFCRGDTPVAVPHLVQIAYIPGAVIRRSVVNLTDFDEDFPVESSVEVCIDVWDSGNRVMINPNITYVSNRNDIIRDFKHIKEVPGKVQKIFRREYI